MDGLLEKLKDPLPRWCLVGVVVFILLRLKLVLFAAGLPILVYWHFSKETENSEETDNSEGSPATDLPSVPIARRKYSEEDDDNEPLKNFGATQPGEVDPYDTSFWNQKAQAPRDPLLDNPAEAGDSFLMGGNAANRSLDDDFDFGLPSLGSSDMDFLGGGFGGGFGGLDGDGFGGGKGRGKGGGKGKGKGKDGEGKGKGKDGPRVPDARQLFIAGIGDLDEGTIREFFENDGQVERLKVLRHEDGQSKGVCFVTFQTEEQAQEVLRIHSRGADLDGRRLSVRPAGQKAEKGEGKGKGDRGKGGFPPRGRDEFDSRGVPRDRDDRDTFGEDPPPKEDDSDEERRPHAAQGGRGRHVPAPPKAEERTELDELLEEALEEEDGPLRIEDFDAGAKRFLEELMIRDRNGGTQRSVEAVDMVFQGTRSKSRESVRKWPAYVFTLLQKFDPALCDELAEKNLERKMKDRERRNRDGTAPRHDEVSRARELAPPADTPGARQVLDRWGKPVVIF